MTQAQIDQLVALASAQASAKHSLDTALAAQTAAATQLPALQDAIGAAQLAYGNAFSIAGGTNVTPAQAAFVSASSALDAFVATL